MPEYKLEIKDTSDPESRLVFLNRLEKFLDLLRGDGIIDSYSLSTPNNVTCIFKVEAEG